MSNNESYDSTGIGHLLLVLVVFVSMAILPAVIRITKLIAS